MPYTHDEVKMLVRDILEHYGFQARVEQWIEADRWRRLDVHATCGAPALCEELSVAVEVENTSKMQKDISTLAQSGADLKFLVLLDRPSFLPRIEGIEVVYWQDFEENLRGKLKIPLKYPKAPAIPTQGIVTTGKVQFVEELERKLAILGLSNLREAAENLLVKTYAIMQGHGEMLTTVSWEEGGTLSPSGKIQPQHKSEYLEEPDVVHTLQQIGLLAYEKGSGNLSDGRYYRAELTSEGLAIAKELVEKRMVENEDKIDVIIQRHGSLMPFIGSLPLYSPSAVQPNAQGEEPPNAYEIAFSPPTLSWEPTSEGSVPKKLLIFNHIAQRLPRINKALALFWAEFEPMGLSFEVLNFIPRRGRYPDYVTMVPELANYVVRESLDEAMDVIEKNKLIEEEGSLSVLELMSPPYTGTKSPQELLDVYGGTLERVRELVEETHRQGITSLLAEEFPYIIVLDRDKFDQFIAGKAKALEEKILNASTDRRRAFRALRIPRARAHFPIA